jgi:hypothetical protein
MRWNGFGASVLFAAVAAAGFAPFALAVAPWYGTQWALVGYAMLVVPAYLFGIGDSRRRGCGAALLATALGAAVAALDPTPREALLGAAGLLALARSGVAYPGAFGRAVAVELGLGAVALAVAHFLIGGSVLSIVLSIWGFFLVHSAYFALPGAGARGASARASRDPFEDARDRAHAILDAVHTG